jgi:hypothetical protein
MLAFDCPVRDRPKQRQPATSTTGIDLGPGTPTAPAPTTRLSDAGSPDERAFANVLETFGRHGGFLDGNEVVEQMCRKNGADLSSVAQRIVARELICFERRGKHWLPMMQFNPVDMSMRPALARVAAELRGVFDAWELCCWLATPNCAVDNRAPLDVLAQDADAVWQAARLDRFVACG